MNTSFQMAECPEMHFLLKIFSDKHRIHPDIYVACSFVQQPSSSWNVCIPSVSSLITTAFCNNFQPTFGTIYGELYKKKKMKMHQKHNKDDFQLHGLQWGWVILQKCVHFTQKPYHVNCFLQIQNPTFKTEIEIYYIVIYVNLGQLNIFSLNKYI